jgi:monovalent cation:proton antiporter-2 (CPA2) family protein
MTDTLLALVIMLGLASLAAMLSRRLGMGTILGLLLAGMVAGPHGLALVRDVGALRHWSEIGVAFLLFLIGLELHPRRLWMLRREVFGLGSAQVGLTWLLLGGGVWALTQDWRLALLVGAGLSLSSTAMVLQTLRERDELEQPHGKTSFAILLLQDMAVVPMVALVPLLALQPEDLDWSALPARLAVMAGAIVAIMALGYWGLPLLLRLAERHGGREAFAGLLLAGVLGAALLGEWAGLSMALGGFLLGLMLSDGDHGLSIEHTVQPFKSLLLGFFFVVVGMSVALPKLATLWLPLAVGLPAVMLVKAAVLFVLVRASGQSTATAGKTALYLPQCGEFGFVLFAAAAASGLLDAAQHTLLILLISLTMLVTPFLIRAREQRQE